MNPADSSWNGSSASDPLAFEVVSDAGSLRLQAIAETGFEQIALLRCHRSANWIEDVLTILPQVRRVGTTWLVSEELRSLAKQLDRIHDYFLPNGHPTEELIDARQQLASWIGDELMPLNWMQTAWLDDQIRSWMSDYVRSQPSLDEVASPGDLSSIAHSVTRRLLDQIVQQPAIPSPLPAMLANPQSRQPTVHQRTKGTA